MTVSESFTYCMNKPSAQQSVHSDWKATQIKVDDVMFAMVHEIEIDVHPAVALKCSPALAELIREQHSDVHPSAHLNPSHWNTVLLEGSLKDSQIYYLVDAALQRIQKQG
ncbi:MmcQ/YjbR family DNA-binding protein [Candidatus Erwinia dacicola]|uniref:MmcQ/YjbR family DNA-binding protein n=2 Tax=Candidatus Erwinia dacicola TaxID=252393 RepID=A0A1E7YV32_9GAMM|nr:MmcQ/YjbR family DNA-binding protein [Candidatus Erwinia dacicola]NJD00869.1 MmcQ/YjbR family DNA-binding protein [Candidatus Erwinia dacicola]NJD85415.1 MmcQ/YjbR family DNA-binding protein [Candidatus Erwinia dacicola]OFC58886.1 hypothetical protein BBW68_02685 [Candidatus Erwinia dacicola]